MAKKRGQNEGTITKRKDGRYMGRIRLGYDVNGKEVRRTVYGRTKREVLEKLDVLKQLWRQGYPVAVEQQTVRQHLTCWLEEVAKPSIRPSTYRSYEQIVRNHLIPALGRNRLTALTPQHVQIMINAKTEAGLAPNSVRTIRAVLRKALNQAVKYGQVPRNVAALADPPATKHYEARYLNLEQARIFVTAIEGDRLEALYRVAVALGLRQGEILGLRWADIDLERRTMNVRFQMQRVEGKFQFVEVKSHQSVRIVDLPMMLMRVMRAHRARQNQERLLAGDRWQDWELVFCTKHGTPFDGPNVTRYFQAVLEGCGLPRLRFHELRHSCASLLAAQGLSPDEVRRLLGHSDIRLTLNTYTHQFPEMRRRAADAMDALFGDPSEAAQ